MNMEATQASMKTTTVLSARGIGKTVKSGEDDLVILREIGFDVAAGEAVAIVGASGSGKSTLVDLVARFIDPSEGRITVDGVDLRELKLADWNALYAMVGQVPFLFHTTIGENIAYGKPTATQAEIEAARALGLPVYASRDWHPEGHVSFRTAGGPWPPHCLQDSPGAAFHPALALPAGTVKSRLFRARAKLKTLLERTHAS